MRHFAAAFLALCFCLLAACAGMEGGRPAVPVQPETPPPETPPVEPEYQLDAATAENTFTAEDGTEVAHYTYTLLTLAVVNGEELPREIAEAVERNVDLFNETMAVLMEKSSETGRIMGEDALSGYTVWDRNSIYYYDETSARGELLGEIVSVRLDNQCFTGGAHPNRYVSSFLFDLRAGQFINPIQIADTPEAFRTGAAAVLLEKLEERGDILGSCWPEYAEIARALSREAEAVRAKLPPGAALAALCIEGKLHSSEELAGLLDTWGSRGEKCLAFVIGGSFGLDEGLKREARVRLSMSPMTFPHHLARVMLLEQLYRGFQINEGGKYHK